MGEYRSAEEVLNDHLALAQAGDISTDLARNFAPDCVLLTSFGVFRGHEGCREAAKLLDEQVGRTKYVYRRKLCEEPVAFLEWAVSNERAWINDGADSYWIHHGLIHAMTIHYTVHVRPPATVER
jgi:hypothetical protein